MVPILNLTKSYFMDSELVQSVERNLQALSVVLIPCWMLKDIREMGLM